MDLQRVCLGLVQHHSTSACKKEFIRVGGIRLLLNMVRSIASQSEDAESTSRLVQIFELLQSLPIVDMCNNDEDFPLILHEIQIFLLRCYSAIGRSVPHLSEKTAAERTNLKRLCGLRRLETDRKKASAETEGGKVVLPLSEQLLIAASLVGTAREEYRRKR